MHWSVFLPLTDLEALCEPSFLCFCPSAILRRGINLALCSLCFDPSLIPQRGGILVVCAEAFLRVWWTWLNYDSLIPNTWCQPCQLVLKFVLFLSDPEQWFQNGTLHFSICLYSPEIDTRGAIQNVSTAVLAADSAPSKQCVSWLTKHIVSLQYYIYICVK